MRRRLPIFFALAMAVGLAGGLVYSWELDPVELYDVAPQSLGPEAKGTYLTLVGDGYAYHRDLAAAESQLAQLGISADGLALAKWIEQYLDQGGDLEEVRNLARLAADLGASGGVLVVFGPTPSPSPRPTFTPSPTVRPEFSPTPPPSATPAPIFRLVDQTAVCGQPGQPGKIAVRVRDREGRDWPGVQIVAAWATGEDRFFTGLRTEQGDGYADLEMSPQVEYEVSLADFRGDIARGLTAIPPPGMCPTTTQSLNWWLTFQETP